MRDTEEGLNEEEGTSSPAELQQENPPSQSSSTEEQHRTQSDTTEMDQTQQLDEENAEAEGQLQQPQSNQSPHDPSEAESVDGNEKSDVRQRSGSPAEESSESPLCDTECGSSLANPELEAEGDFEDDTQGGSYPCQHCERHFSTKQGLERHAHIHTTSNHQTHTFKCRYCTKPFGSQVGKRRHERRHENGSKTLNRPGTAFLHSPSTPNDSATSSSVSSPSHAVVVSPQNGPPQQNSDSVKKEAAADSYRPFIVDENGESKELHPCKYCNKAFGTHTNMRRHQRRIHERHLMPKGVRRKGMLLQDSSSQQQQQQHEQGKSVLVQEESPSASPPPIYVPSVDTEDEGEREECMVDISNNISENLSHYIDGKITSTSTVSNCEVIEVDSSTAALFGLDALIINPKQISHALKVETRTCPANDVSCAAQSVSRRRTATPPLLPAVKVETEAASSSSSLSSPSSQSPLLVGNIFSQSAETLAFQKEKSVYLSPKLKQLLQAPDGQKPAIGLITDSHRLTTPLTVTSLPAVQGRFKRRTASPPTTLQNSPSQRNDDVSNAGVPCLLKVPKIESHCITNAWSPSCNDQDAVNLTGKDWSPSRSGGNSCNQQPLDLSNSFSKKDNTVSKSTGEAVLDLSMSRKSDNEVKSGSAVPPHVKRKKPNTSILEKVLMNEYAGLSSPGDDGSNTESPDALSPSESTTCIGPSSPGSGSERLPCESTSPPSLTPMTINPSSPSSSSIESSTPPPPVLPSAPSPPPLSSHHTRMSDSSSFFPYPALSPKTSPKPVEQSSEEVSETATSTTPCHDALNPNELDQTAKQSDPAISASPQDTKRHCKADFSSKSETLLEGSTRDTKLQLLRNADQASSSFLERDAACETSQSRSCEGTLPQDLDIKTEGRHKSKSSHSAVQSTPKRESPSPSFPSELQPSQKTSVVNNLVEEDTGKKEEPDDVAENGDGVSASPGTPARYFEEIETAERETFVKSFVCNVCKEPFRSIKDLSGHILEHASEWPFKCEFCVQLFGNATALLEHRSSLHGVGRIYVCSVCSKEFAFLCNLHQHQSDLHPIQACTHTAVENGKLRPQNYTDPAQANVERISSDTIADLTAIAPSQESSEEHNNNDTKTTEDEENSHEDPTEELYTTIKIMASEAGKPKGPDVRLGINQHYPSFKPPPFPYHNRSPDGSVASATHFTTHNIPQTFSTAIRCTKCGNSFDNMPELHKHILVCANASDKRRYTPKKNPIPLKQVVKQSPNGVISTTVADVGQNAFRRMGQPKRLNFNQDIASKTKLTALNKKKNQLVQKAIFQKNKSAASAKKPTTRVKDEETHGVHMCPHCSREFTYPASLAKHIACSCPQRPLPKKLKKGALTPQDKNMNLRSRAADSEIKQETGSGPGTKPLGKTRARSSEPVESEVKPANKGKSPQVRTKRPALSADNTAPHSKKGKKSNDPQTSITPVITDDPSTRPLSKMQRGPKDVAVKKEAVVKTSQSKKEERFSVRTRERLGGPVTRSAQVASASAPLEVKTEDPLNHEPGQSEKKESHTSLE